MRLLSDFSASRSSYKSQPLPFGGRGGYLFETFTFFGGCFVGLCGGAIILSSDYGLFSWGDLFFLAETTFFGFGSLVVFVFVHFPLCSLFLARGSPLLGGDVCS